MTDDEYRRLEAILTFALNLESAGDVIERNITAFAAKHLKRGMELSPDAEREIAAAFDAVRANLRSASSVFMTGDPRAARVLTEQKAEFRRREFGRDQDPFCGAPRSEQNRGGADVGARPHSRHQEAQRPSGCRGRLSGARSERRPDAEPDRRRQRRRPIGLTSVIARLQGIVLLAAAATRLAKAATSFLSSGSLISETALLGSTHWTSRWSNSGHVSLCLLTS